MNGVVLKSMGQEELISVLQVVVKMAFTSDTVAEKMLNKDVLRIKNCFRIDLSLILSSLALLSTLLTLLSQSTLLGCARGPLPLVRSLTAALPTSGSLTHGGALNGSPTAALSTAHPLRRSTTPSGSAPSAGASCETLISQGENCSWVIKGK
ncbi:hypothetical protein RIF29_21786 [Crotalaria pallida]|uniref:Uncharacterized protein n=1 Tax=Crotalaria pallida TaxID=3830 RepID=A0AAN9F837_CROPI